MPSQRERDLARRRRDTNATPKRLWLWVLGGLVAVAVVAILASLGSGAPEGRAANAAAFGLKDDPFKGPADAPVILVGFESPHCSACKGFHNNYLPTLEDGPIARGEVAYYYIQGSIGDDEGSSIAQECIFKHVGAEAFWHVTDRLYARANTYTQPPWSSWFDDLAASHGADAERLRDCHETEETASAMAQDFRIGRDMGAQGTPTFWAFSTGEAVKITRYTDIETVVAGLLEDARAE